MNRSAVFATSETPFSGFSVKSLPPLYSVQSVMGTDAFCSESQEDKAEYLVKSAGLYLNGFGATGPRGAAGVK